MKLPTYTFLFLHAWWLLSGWGSTSLCAAILSDKRGIADTGANYDLLQAVNAGSTAGSAARTFLLLQRDNPSLLAAWQTLYGAQFFNHAGEGAILAVPEPVTGTGLFILVGSALFRRTTHRIR